MAMIEDAPHINSPPNAQNGLLNGSKTNGEEWSVEQVLSSVSNPPTENTDSPIGFFHIIERLKTTKRAGWKRFGVEHGESISDHMYRMSILTMLAPPSLSSRLNVPHCTKMALIHDMAESLVGDITPVDNVPKTEKSRRESETMDYICTRLLGNVPGLSGEDIRKIWQEYEDDQTLEAHFVHDVDKMELILQMVEYERASDCTRDLGEFTWVSQKIQLPEVKKWCEDAFEERTKLWQSFGKTAKWWYDQEKSENMKAVRRNEGSDKAT